MSKARQGTRKRVAPQKYAFLWRLMADAVISSPAKVVATTLLLKFHNTKTGRCNPSIGALTKTTGLSRRTIFYAVTELRNAGWIAVQSTGGGSPTHTNKFSFDFGGVRSTVPQPVHQMHPQPVQTMHPAQTVHRCTKCPQPVHSLHTNHLEPPALRAGGMGRKFPPAARLTARRQNLKNCANSGSAPTA